MATQVVVWTSESVGPILGLVINAWFRGAVRPSHIAVIAAVLLIVAFLILGSVRSKGRNLTAIEMANLIERFLDGRSLHPQEWNDFIERSQRDRDLDRFRKRCYELDPLVNRPGSPDPEAMAALRSLANELRARAHK